MLHSFCIKEIDSFSQEARSSPVERAQGSYAALRAPVKLGMPVRKLRRGCAAGKILDGKTFGGRCAGQKSWRGTHVVVFFITKGLYCIYCTVLCYSRQSTWQGRPYLPKYVAFTESQHTNTNAATTLMIR